MRRFFLGGGGGGATLAEPVPVGGNGVGGVVGLTGDEATGAWVCSREGGVLATGWDGSTESDGFTGVVMTGGEGTSLGVVALLSVPGNSVSSGFFASAKLRCSSVQLHYHREIAC